MWKSQRKTASPPAPFPAFAQPLLLGHGKGGGIKASLLAALVVLYEKTLSRTMPFQGTLR